MNSRMFGCGKFKWLSIEKFDRELSPKEQLFYRKHREVCFTCLRFEQQSLNAMNLLGAATIEHEVSEDFDERVLRSLRVATAKRPLSIKSWSPAVAGALVATMALMAAMQVLSKAPTNKIHDGGGRDEGAYNRFYNNDPSTFPELVLPVNLTR